MSGSKQSTSSVHFKNPARIIGIQFGMLSPEEIRKGVVEVVSKDTYINNKEVPGGLFDPRMGVLGHGTVCPTDGLTHINTPGYFGYIELARPVFFIQHIKDIMSILKCVCFKCSKLLISKEDHKHVSNMKSMARWDYVYSKCSGINRCGEATEQGCGCKQPDKIKLEEMATIVAIWDNLEKAEDATPEEIAAIRESGKSQFTMRFTAEIVLKIFKRISDEDVQFMGFSPIWSRPDWMVCQVLPVAPPSVRPSVKQDANQRSEDDLTHIYGHIIKTNKDLEDRIQNNAAPHVIDGLTKVLQYFIAMIANNKVKGAVPMAQRSGRPLQCITDRLNSKNGRIRGNLMGKRVDFSARSVITGDPNLSAKQLGVPKKVAMNLTKPVVVNDRNRNFLTMLVQNGPDVYPGAKNYEKKNGDTISLRNRDRMSIRLENGDIVHRHMMDGDPVLFNRQPSLHRMSMMCHIAKIMERGDTFRMNVCDTKPYNADFDGDEMNMHMPQNVLSETELRHLAAIPYQIISPSSNSPLIGIYQDSMLGTYRFTRPDVEFSPREAMNILMGYSRVDVSKLVGKNKITNFDILSQITPPLTLKTKTKQYDDKVDDYATSNNVLEIFNGKYVRGQMIASTVKGVLSRVCNDFGNMACSDYIDDLQQVITEYMKTSAYSVGVSDLISDRKTTEEILQVIAAKKTEVQQLTDKMHLGIFENKTGNNNAIEYENQVKGILNKATDQTGAIAKKSLSATNRFLIMVASGSKGNMVNISQMISCLGQQSVDGKRVPYGFDSRTLPHFSKYDDSPGARGFVENSYISGLTAPELFFHAMGGRMGLIDTAVKSVTWETPIVLIDENGKPVYTEIGRWIDAKLDNSDNKSRVQHFDEKNMELLNVNSIYVPTTCENGLVSWEEITAVTRHDPGTQLYEIKTLGGRSVTVTESKSLLVWNKEKQGFYEMLTPEIVIGDCVPVTAELCEPPVILNHILLSDYLPKDKFVYGTDFNCAINSMNECMQTRKKIPVGWWNSNNGTKFTLPYSKKSSLQRTMVRGNIANIKNECVYPYHAQRVNEATIGEKFELNYDNGLFIGLFLAEGNIHNSHIYITNNNENIRNFVKSWFEKQGIHWIETQKINKIGGLTTGVNGCSSVLSQFITKLVGHGAHGKYVPTEAFIANIDFVGGLLNGYFSGDGTVSKNSVEASSASKRLIEGIGMLCSRFGIFGKVFITKMKKNNLGTVNIRPAYRISIRGQWGQRFADKVKLIDDAKQARLLSIKWNAVHRNFATHNNVVLDPIVEINVIGVENNPKMYDLTIPTTLNFGLANGLQVRDTSQTGYIQRRLVKGLEDLKVEYDMTVRNNMGKIVQFSYGEDSADPTRIENQSIPIVNMSVEDIYMHYDIVGMTEGEHDLIKIYTKGAATRVRRQRDEARTFCKKYIDYMLETRDQLVANVFKFKNEDSVKTPVSFHNLILNVQGQLGLNANSTVDITPLEAFQMIDAKYETLKLSSFCKPNKLFEVLYYYYLSPKDLLVNKRFNAKAIELLLESVHLNYKKSIVSPGEMVGVIAGQSIGEPTTQMSLTRNECVKIMKVEKGSVLTQVSLTSTKIGDFCDQIISENPELTFNTGHENSVETVLGTSDAEYYIMSVGEDETTKWSKISHVSRHPVNGELMRVKTKSGRMVETTTSHSHLVRQDNKVQPIVGRDMRVGMRIPVSKNINNGNLINETVKIGNKTFVLDELFGWFIGAYLAEGSINYNTICITNISTAFIQNTIEFAARFGKECKIYEKESEYGHTTDVKFTCAELADLLKISCGNGSFNKSVPDFAFVAPDAFKARLIQAYIDGDGNIQCDEKHHMIRACSRSLQLIKDVALLINYFGMFGSIHTTNTRGSELHHLSISAKYAQLYKTNIGSSLESKMVALNGLVEYLNRDDAHSVSDEIDKINGLGHIIAHCGKTLELEGQSRIYGRWARGIKDASTVSIGRRTLQKYINDFESSANAPSIAEELRILKQAADADVVWDEIVEIDVWTPEQSEMVYDFTVPGNQTFLTDYGVYVHNTLNTFHLAGVASKSNVTRGVPRIEEILRLTRNPDKPSVTVYLKPQDQHDKDKATNYCNMLQHTKLIDVVKSVEICFDPNDHATKIHSDQTLIDQFYLFDKMAVECNDNYSAQQPRSKWIIRIEIDAESLLEKNITMDDIHFAVTTVHGSEVSCVYSDMNSSNLVFRIRLNSSIFNRGKKKGAAVHAESLDQTDEIYLLKNFQDSVLNNIVLRGVNRIVNVNPRIVKDMVVKEDGKYARKEAWVLDTTGSNLMDIFAMDFIDYTRTYSNDIREMYNVLGIEAARQNILNEIVDVMEASDAYVNYHHLSILCDRMTVSKDLVPIYRSGILNDDIGPISKSTYEMHTEMFLQASRHGEFDQMRGVSANVMCGQQGYYGTNAFGLLLDMEAVMNMEDRDVDRKDVNDRIEELFGTIGKTDECSINRIRLDNNVHNLKNVNTGVCEDDGYEVF